MTKEIRKIDLKKLIIPIAAVVAVIAVVLTIVLVSGNKESYRLIKINSFEGGIELQREEKGNVEVFKGLQLISADTVAVGEGSFLELLADSDKHIAAEENTGFKLYSSGDEKSGNISIDLLYGKALFTIDNKLNEGSFFQVTSPNATLSVRGTTFSTEYNAEEEKTVAEVIEGSVLVTCEGGGILLEKGDKVAVIGSGDNVRIEEITDSEYLLTLAKTYPQTEKYTEGKAEHFITVSEYTATEAGISDTVYSDSEKQGSPLVNPQLMLKGCLDSHAEEVNKYFEENKETAVKSGNVPDKDVTEWISGNITIGGATFNVEKAYLNISVKGKSSDAHYFTSETHKVRENGRDMYYYADGVTLTVYGSKSETPAVTTTAATTTTTTPPVTTTTTAPPLAEAAEYFGFTIEWNKFKINESIADYVLHFHNFENEEKYSGFGSSDPEKYFSGIIKAIEKRSAEMSKYYEKNYQAENEYSASVTNRTDSVKPQTTEAVAGWFDKTITVTDDKGKTIKLSLNNVTMNLGGAKLSVNTIGNLPEEKYCLYNGDNIFIQDRIVFDFYGEIIKDGDSTVTTPVVTEAPEVTTKVTTAAPVTTTKKTTATTDWRSKYPVFSFTCMYSINYDSEEDKAFCSGYDIEAMNFYRGYLSQFQLDIDPDENDMLDFHYDCGYREQEKFDDNHTSESVKPFALDFYEHVKANNENIKSIFKKYKKNNYERIFKKMDKYGVFEEEVDIDVSKWFPDTLIFESKYGNRKINVDHIKVRFHTSFDFEDEYLEVVNEDNYKVINPKDGKEYYLGSYLISFDFYGSSEVID